MRCEVYDEQNSEAHLCSKKHVFYNCVCVLRGTALALRAFVRKACISAMFLSSSCCSDKKQDAVQLRDDNEGCRTVKVET